MRSKKKIERENTALREEVDGLKEILAFSFETTRLGIVALAGDQPATQEDMNTLAEQFPRWSVRCVTAASGFDGDERKLKKIFRRDLDDLRSDLHRDRDTYLRFADPEYFDIGLRDALKVVSDDPATEYISGTGELGWSGDGPTGHFELTIEDEGEITKLDLIRIKSAEQYLAGQDLFAKVASA